MTDSQWLGLFTAQEIEDILAAAEEHGVSWRTVIRAAVLEEIYR